MTPQQHLQHAEFLLTMAEGSRGSRDGSLIANDLMTALCHALIAHAAEAGVPHSAEPAEGGGPGAHPLDPRL